MAGWRSVKRTDNWEKDREDEIDGYREGNKGKDRELDKKCYKT